MHSWPSQPQQPPHPLYLYQLVPLQREPETLKASPQMQIYNESNDNIFTKEDESYIMKKFTKFLEENPSEISKISSSNVKVSYNISQRNELSLSFKFEDKTANEAASSDSSKITFINKK